MPRGCRYCLGAVSASASGLWGQAGQRGRARESAQALRWQAKETLGQKPPPNPRRGTVSGSVHSPTHPHTPGKPRGLQIAGDFKLPGERKSATGSGVCKEAKRGSGCTCASAQAGGATTGMSKDRQTDYLTALFLSMYVARHNCHVPGVE